MCTVPLEGEREQEGQTLHNREYHTRAYANSIEYSVVQTHIEHHDHGVRIRQWEESSPIVNRCGSWSTYTIVRIRLDQPGNDEKGKKLSRERVKVNAKR
jgi:hypothetical protein